MKLTNDMRDAVVMGLIEKAFPKSELDRMKEALSDAVMKTDEFREARDMYVNHRKYVHPSTRVCTGIYVYYRRHRSSEVDLSLPLDYAGRWVGWCFQGLSVNEDDIDRISSDEIEKVMAELSSFSSRMREFMDSISQIVSAYTSTGKLIEAIPDAAEFLPKDGGSVALVPKEQIDSINKALGRAI